MEPLLGAKIGCLFALLVLTLVCGLIPICFKWFQTTTATGCHRRVLSFLGCTSAGVFLGAGFMHMTAEALEGIKSEIQNLVIQNRTKNEGHSDDDADSAYVFLRSNIHVSSWLHSPFYVLLPHFQFSSAQSLLLLLLLSRFSRVRLCATP
ncbi:zinc transporter ZIP2 isoform X3 [Bubalus bubalis]|uniref:zinc transporter ZIP2 isoform X3 n=1 Tax=Bubalus bubalis TaxID=89462 RepID=UPI00042CD07C|nr:zinc transporter ZIP2 isoform X3 [Bubalus bubalis]